MGLLNPERAMGSGGNGGIDDLHVDSGEESVVSDKSTNGDENQDELELESAGMRSPTAQSDRFSIR